MAGEITGAKHSNLTCKPKIDTTDTEAVWRERIVDGGYPVKFDAATTTADEIGVTFLAQNDAVALGRLIGSTGSGTDFRVTVETEGAYGYFQGGGTAAFTTAELGKRAKADANHKLVVDTSLTAGNLFVVGGDKAEPAIKWQGEVA